METLQEVAETSPPDGETKIEPQSEEMAGVVANDLNTTQTAAEPTPIAEEVEKPKDDILPLADCNH